MSESGSDYLDNDKEIKARKSQKGEKHDREFFRNSKLYFDVPNSKLSIIYHPKYNIRLLGLEKLHPFDAGKWGNAYQFLKEANILDDATVVNPEEATHTDLCIIHTPEYLSSLNWSCKVSAILEVPFTFLLPNFILQRAVLKPFRYQVGGTVLAGKLAMERGWAINLGGGFHHCCGYRGGGFCVYADLSLCIKFLLHHYPRVTKVMIVDLDAHQGNGHERDFIDDPNVFIIDAYNTQIYPNDNKAKRAIDIPVHFTSYTEDEEYLGRVTTCLERGLNEFHPHFLLYNAGTDILEGDSLGRLSVSENGIYERDEMVFQKAKSRNIPIMMVTSGGYQRVTARIIAQSIRNLQEKGLLHSKTSTQSESKK